ncbi:MAG: redox-regulated ATPase YchF [candidate division Zixibacteria bacterium HGW-Zixibacteria-1]|nr:MAG: redox-regulated ATPase YchF [candidate division Zixibacteria bacterium HGW-Zixibacteria-1]
MKLGIVGLPQSGKTTLFNAASGQQEAVGDYSQASHRAVIKVPDRRLAELSDIHQPKKITYAEIEFLDAPGFTGKGKKGRGDLEILHDLRLVDAIVIVVDNFSPGSHPEQDLQALNDEMVLSDLMIIEHNIEKLARTIKLTGHQERARELEVLQRCHEALNNDKLLIEIGLSEEDKKEVRGYSFLTLKPQLITFNIAEEMLPDYAALYAGYEKFCREGMRDISVICGKIEMELAVLSDEDRQAFLKELNIEKPVVDKFIRKSFKLLGLITFFTVGPPECRAWTLRKGSPAPKAAGTVHTDFERGFIRAEVATYDDYMIYKTLPALKAAAKLHVEGKDYVVQDGDVILFRFNI